MKKSFAIAILIQFLLVYNAASQINVLRIDNNSAPQTKDGIFYSLPRTVIKIDVKIDRVENYQGPYADFALRFLGLKNVISANSIDYKISNITITTYPEPDPDQYYFVELGDKINSRNSF